MWIKFGAPLLAAGALGFGAATTVILTPQEQVTVPPNPPAVTTLGPATVAGLGQVQPPGETTAIGAPVSGLVREVHVVDGQAVRSGDPLFALDDRQLRAELRVREQTLAADEAGLARLRAAPRPEDLPPARAAVAAARVGVDRARDAMMRAQRLVRQNAIGEAELRASRFDLRQTEAGLEHAESELRRLEAGAWEQDIAVARQQVRLSRARVDQVRVELDRLIVRSPIDGVVLKINVRAGELVDASSAAAPPALLGSDGPLQVRVQVDEEDAGRVRAGAAAEGYLRGRDRARVGLRFVRIEPRLTPKPSLTGGITERVDTRVLFVVYEVVDPPERVYVGQTLDVFIAADRGRGLSGVQPREGG